MNRDVGPSRDEGRIPNKDILGKDILGKDLNKDISPVLKGWDYEPGGIKVRKIVGMDGAPKLQMRLDLGLFQMELTGRPDGTRPHGCESLLDYFEQELDDHRTRNGTELGFHLDSQQCQLLREEAAMYYHRYIGLFFLEDFTGVVRDTARNLRVLDLCTKYAGDERDRLVLEQYRPYIMMMNARAEASILCQREDFKAALACVNRALATIKEFFTRFGQEEAYGQSSEVRVLKKLGREIRRKLPVDPMAKLQQQLEKAVKTERYEDAARIRDEIKKRTQ